MTRCFWRSTALLFVLSAAVPVTTSVAAAEKTAQDLLPASTVGYLEIAQPGKLIDVVLDHPLAVEIEKQPEYQRLLRSPQYEQFRSLLKRFEEQLGTPWRKAAASLTTGGLYFGFDLPTQGVVGLAQAADEKLAEKARDALLELARSTASAGGKNDPVKEDEHRGVKIYELGDAHLAVCGKWLVATNKRPLIWMVLENYLTASSSLGADEQFRMVSSARGPQPATWLYVDLRVLRAIGPFRSGASKKSDNPPLEVVAGGIIGAVPDAAYVTASLQLDASRLKLTATLPCNPRAVAKTREFYLGPEAAGAAPPLLHPNRTLLAISTYRDFASLWRNAPDIFDQKINAQMVETESRLTTFFAGRNFRDDILGNVEPGIQLVAVRQEFPQGGITPAIKLPAGALVARMKKPEETARMFKISFQSLIGFLNIAAAGQGIGPLEMNTEKLGGALVISSQYLPPTKAEARTEAPLQYNASPTIAFVGDRFILSSSRQLALELAEQLQQESTTASSLNTVVALDAKVGQAALADNRNSLVAQNMLSRGHDRAAAEDETDRLLKALKFLDSASLRLTTGEDKLQLTAEVVLTK
jgi:hypothetical protein